MKHDKWQQEVLEADGDILVNTGRQVGKTTTFSKKIAKYMLKHPNSRIIVVSLTEDQAKLIIIMVLTYLENNNKKDIVRKGKNKVTTSRIHLNNKSSVISRPVGNTGDAVRGFTGDVLYIDEASGMPEMMWKAAMPTLMTTGGQIWMSSTPRGKFVAGTNDKNFFFKCWENVEDRWKVFNISSEEVINNREIDIDWNEEKRAKAIKFLENQKAILTKMEYDQEYMGLFLDDNRQWFSDELIRSCMINERPNKIVAGKDCYLGVDIARMGEDESTFEIIEMKGDNLFHIENQITTKTSLSDTTHHIEGLHRLYDFSKIFIDDEGIGVGVLDFLLDNDETKNQVIGINNSKQIIDKDGREKKLQKTLLYSNMKRLMEMGKIKLLDEASVFQSLKSVQYAYSNDSLGVRHLKIFGNYTHIAEGLVRAAWCVKYKHLNLWVSSIKV